MSKPYDHTSSYKRGARVTYHGDTYAAIRDVPSGYPPGGMSMGVYWRKEAVSKRPTRQTSSDADDSVAGAVFGLGSALIDSFTGFDGGGGDCGGGGAGGSD